MKQQYKRTGVCPFTLQDSTVERFKLFVKNFPEYKQISETRCTETVKDRKSVLKICQQTWRASKRVKIGHTAIIKISKGDIFKRAFTPCSWEDEVSGII